MLTKAGQRLLEREIFNSRSFAIVRESDIAAIEAEAIATERARIREAVEGLPGLVVAKYYSEPDRIERAAVLALLKGDDNG